MAIAGPVAVDTAFNPISLRFRSPQAEAQFLAAFYTQRRRQFQYSTMACIVAVCAFGPVDRIVAPQLADEFLWIRLGIAVPALLVGLAVLSHSATQSFMRRWICEATLALVVAVLAPLGVMIWLLLEGATEAVLFIGLMADSIAIFLLVGLTRLRFSYLVVVAAVNFLCAVSFPYLRTEVPLWIEPALLGFLLAYSLVVVFVGYALERADRQAFIQKVRLDVAHARADELLRNILPERIIGDLQSGREPIADRHEDVSVLFADIVGFTPLAERLSADELVGLLHTLFSEFDRLTDRIGVEKIKTIGDAYMVVAGAPTPRSDHADAVAELALEMMAVAERVGYPELQLRVGIHSGPLVAGVIGLRKFAFDVWGDTVNTAARLESHGEPGRVQLSEATRSRLSERFEVESRGVIELKGKGPVSAFWLVPSEPNR